MVHLPNTSSQTCSMVPGVAGQMALTAATRRQMPAKGEICRPAQSAAASAIAATPPLAMGSRMPASISMPCLISRGLHEL